MFHTKTTVSVNTATEITSRFDLKIQYSWLTIHTNNWKYACVHGVLHTFLAGKHTPCIMHKQASAESGKAIKVEYVPKFLIPRTEASVFTRACQPPLIKPKACQYIVLHKKNCSYKFINYHFLLEVTSYPVVWVTEYVTDYSYWRSYHMVLMCRMDKISTMRLICFRLIYIANHLFSSLTIIFRHVVIEFSISS